MCVCVCAQAPAFHSMQAEVRGQPAGAHSLPRHPFRESGTDGVEASTFVHLVISRALILSFKAAALKMIFKLFNSY